MKIIGTAEEICAINDFLTTSNSQLCCDSRCALSGGKWRGFNIDFVIEKKPMTIGMIIPPVNLITNLTCIAEKHGGLSFAIGGILNAVNEYKCKNGTKICCLNSYGCLRGCKFDELWMSSLPSDWHEFDLCFTSVTGDRTKIHFYKELDNDIK